MSFLIPQRLRSNLSGLLLGEEKRFLGEVLQNQNSLEMEAIFPIMRVLEGVDSQLRFSIDPPATESGFCEWRDAMKAVARLPGGVPPHFRKNVSKELSLISNSFYFQLWSTLATQHIDSLGVDWDEVGLIIDL